MIGPAGPIRGGSGTLGELQLVESDSDGSEGFRTHEEEVAGSWLLTDSIFGFCVVSEGPV